ncbi:MAG TPA: RNA polymerase sigma factor, partial [Clostridia bacterium]|nr:RNA polymerase sigma factor [Clostridia bacterium]
MDNPFSDDKVEDADHELVTRAQAGDRQALEELITRHEPWIYNLAVRILYTAENAEDATQDVLIHMMTGIRTFRGESKFRTWLYRLATNHILNFKKKWAAAEPAYTFEWFAGDLDATGLADIPDPRTVPVPIEVLIAEAKMSCTAAMLLCLDGRQRLVYTLGEIFGVSDSVGAEVVGITPANFRQILARARRDLYS